MQSIQYLIHFGQRDQKSFNNVLPRLQSVQLVLSSAADGSEAEGDEVREG